MRLYLSIAALLLTWSQSFSAQELKKPEVNEENRVYTLNNMGAMNLNPGKIDQEYLKSLRPGHAVMDVGCAYGHTVKEAAEKGAQVWAIDLDKRHLQILENDIKNQRYKDQIHYVSGDFTQQNQLPNNFFDKVLMARVLQFMDGPRIEKALNLALKSLKPGGEVYILTSSAHMKAFQSCMADYKKRKEQGEKWPGYFTDMWERNEHHKNRIPQEYHLIELDVLEKAVKEAGFEIVRAEYEALPYKSERVQLDGREYVTIVAKKPL